MIDFKNVTINDLQEAAKSLSMFSTYLCYQDSYVKEVIDRFAGNKDPKIMSFVKEMKKHLKKMKKMRKHKSK